MLFQRILFQAFTRNLLFLFNFITVFNNCSKSDDSDQEQEVIDPTIDELERDLSQFLKTPTKQPIVSTLKARLRRSCKIFIKF